MRLDWISLRGVGPFTELRLEFPEGTRGDLADAYLLVGPNGSGKSTILRAIATAFGDDGSGARARMWTSGAEISAGFSGADPFILRRDGLMGWSGAPKFCKSGLAGPPYRYWAFAYSGARELADLRASGIGEPLVDPTAAAVQFDRASGEGDVAQWIVDNDYAHARALRDGAQADAARASRARMLAERLISDLMDQGAARLAVRDRAVGVQARFEVDLSVGGASRPLSAWASGVRATAGWVLDLVMRLDRMPWVDDLAVEDRSFLLLLDEIDVHLHPGWQRRILPLIQRAFPKAQIIVSTHSPFVVGSADDARIYPLALDEARGRARLLAASDLYGEAPDDHVAAGIGSLRGVSYQVILERVFGVKSRFDPETEALLVDYKLLRDAVLRREKPLEDLEVSARGLAMRSEEVGAIVWTEFVMAKGRVAGATGT